MKIHDLSSEATVRGLRTRVCAGACIGSGLGTLNTTGSEQRGGAPSPGSTASCPSGLGHPASPPGPRDLPDRTETGTGPAQVGALTGTQRAAPRRRRPEGPRRGSRLVGSRSSCSGCCVGWKRETELESRDAEGTQQSRTRGAWAGRRVWFSQRNAAACCSGRLRLLGKPT